MKMAEAKISCSPEKPCWGKWGERAQMSSGTLAMRVSVMELGRFTGAGNAREQGRGYSHSPTGAAGVTRAADGDAFWGFFTDACVNRIF